MSAKRLIDRLDAAAAWTGIPGLVAQPPHRRPMRWLPVAVLAVATAGLAVLLFGPMPAYWIGYAVLIMGFCLSAWIPLKGPIKPWMTVTERVDEHDEAMRKDAYLAVLPLILLVAVLALTGPPALAVIGRWSTPQLFQRCWPLGFYLIVLWNAVPTLYASWKWRPVDED